MQIVSGQRRFLFRFIDLVSTKQLLCVVLSCSYRYVVVLVESLAGSGHQFAVKKPKLEAQKIERYCFDPISESEATASILSVSLRLWLRL